MFIALLSFCVATKCVSLNIEPCMIRPTSIDLNPMKLNYYPLVIIQDITEIVVLLMTYLQKCVPGNKRHVMIYMIIYIFNMITRTNEAKTLIKHI